MGGVLGKLLSVLQGAWRNNGGNYVRDSCLRGGPSSFHHHDQLVRNGVDQGGPAGVVPDLRAPLPRRPRCPGQDGRVRPSQVYRRLLRRVQGPLRGLWQQSRRQNIGGPFFRARSQVEHHFLHAAVPLRRLLCLCQAQGTGVSQHRLDFGMRGATAQGQDRQLHPNPLRLSSSTSSSMSSFVFDVNVNVNVNLVVVVVV